LGDILDQTRQLHFLVLSREPVYESWGATKVVNEKLSCLTEMEAARLFLQRIHRRLWPHELVSPGESSPGGMSGLSASPAGQVDGAGSSSAASNPPTREAMLALLCKHPLLRKLNGHPGNIFAVASCVTPTGPSLNELAEQDDLIIEPTELQQQTNGGLHRQWSTPAVGIRPPRVDQPMRPYSATPVH
jgi:hypothetical protein